MDKIQLGQLHDLLLVQLFLEVKVKICQQLALRQF